MKNLIKFFFLSVILIFSMQVPASAADSLQNNLVPQDSDQKKVGEVNLEYNEYPQHHYRLDTWVDTDGDWMPWNWADGAGKQIYIALNELVNSVWSVNILLANFTMLVVQEAFELDFISGVTDQIGLAIQNIAGFGPTGFKSNGLWPLLVTFIFGIVGAWATYVGMVKRESSRAWGGMISALIVFVCALGFFSNASTILKGLNDWSSDLQSDVLGVSASVVNPGASYNKDEGIATIRNQMFDLMVKKPYLLMQYGTTKVDKERVNELLEIDPILKAEDRDNQAKDEVENEKNKMMSIDGVSQRAGFVPLLFLANSVIGIFLLIISGMIILYQMVFLVLVLFAPVPLLMAIVPRWQQTAFDWIMKVLHAQLMKIAIALLLTILFGISAILYRATENGDIGYLGMMLLQIVCFIGIWAKRKELFNIVSAAVGNVESYTGNTLRGYKEKLMDAKRLAGRGKYINGQGRIRNQPLAQRHLGNLNDEQQEERQNQIQSTKDGFKRAKDGVLAGAGAATLANRNAQEFRDGQEDYAKSKKNTTGIENAGIGKDQLADRNTGGQADNENGNVTSLDDARRKRIERGNLANAPLAERPSLQDVQRETAASVDSNEKQDVALSDRTQSERNINLMNQNSHEDKVNEQQSNKITERRTLTNDTEREAHQDTINRERLTNHSNERNVNETINRNNVVNESTESNVNQTTNRNLVNNENINRTENHITDRNNNITNTHREVQNNTSSNETVSKKENIVSRIIENAVKNDKPITKWEAQQQINEKNKNHDKK